jgi:hypothetical protein
MEGQNVDDRKPAAKRSCSEEDGDFNPKRLKKEPIVNTVDQTCTYDVEVLSE